MAKINILDSSIYNRIAAGEVVDRPYSVVKEFVENSLDAGAKNIEIRIERGGKDSVCVSDDGSGIERSELHAAFLPHATSKIARVEDLDLIRTLGFRGEALASIASVSHVRIRSRYKDAEEAYEISCAGGKIGDVIPCARDAGTEICAENLFYNTPVRAKFLKSDKGEEAEITNFVSRFILGNPSVAFRYYVDGKLILQSFGGGQEEALAAVYGGGIVAECYHIDAIKHGIHISGYVGKPSYTKANRTYQSVFVNGRYVLNNTISSAISNAFASYLMKRQYPFYVLFIDVPPEVVDVNVHPNKSDVRFENNQIIYSCIYSVISAVLDGNASALDFVVGAKDPVPEKGSANSQPTVPEEKSQPQQNVAAIDATSTPVNTDKTPEILKDEPFNANKVAAGRDFEPLRIETAQPITETPFGTGGTTSDHAEEIGRMFAPPRDISAGRTFTFRDSGKTEENSSSDAFNENKRYLEMLENKKKQQKLVFENAEYRGCLFNTYLMYEDGDAVYIIDQHAAHERLIFDRLREEMDARKVVRQPMLIPFLLRTNQEEHQFLSEHLPEIEEIGFEVEEFGGDSFKVSSVPMDLQDINLSSFFAEVLGEVGMLRGIRLSELLRDKIAMAACKHAVKGGMALTDSEKEKLFAMLHGDMGLKCPHGRPVAVRLTKGEIEKLFKRIV